MIVNSDYLVICREKLTKILPIFNKSNIIASASADNQAKINLTSTNFAFNNIKRKLSALPDK